MVHHWEDPFEPDDEQDDEGEEWRQEGSAPGASDAETVEQFLEEIETTLYDRDGCEVPRLPDEPAAWQLATWGRLPRATANRLYDQHNRILARWPRLCACGAEFRGPQRQTTRCPTCRQPGRVAKGGSR